LVLVDSNVFIIDRFYPRDALHPQNKTFVEKLVSIDGAVSSFTLLEICGAASFRLSTEELADWLFGFTSVYPVSVLDVQGLKGNNCEAWWSTFVEEVAANIAKKMTFGDAVLLREAENYNVDAIVT
jgi:predicted nucleic acid-binding protein